MRYFIAALIPVVFAVVGFSVLAILMNLGQDWSSDAQQRVATAASLWAHYWWIATIVLAAGAFIWATVSDAMSPAKKKR